MTGVEDRETGELAAWVIEQPSGAMGMLYTQEKYRRRGFARRVVMGLVGEMRAELSAGLRPCQPFAFIVRDNLNSQVCESFHLHLRSAYIHIYMHACMHAYIHTCVHTYIRTSIHTYIHTYIHTCMHACMHACIHTYIHT